MSSDLADRLPFPLYALDFEASGLGEYTYPIEVGIAWWTEPDAPIESWSTLIRPTREWQETFVWSEASQAIHGIEPHELAHGMSPAEALDAANRRIGARIAFCDGGGHDLRWLAHLADAAGIEPTFRLGDWDGLAGLLEPDEYRRMIAWHDRIRVPHRAAADAELLLKALAIGTQATDG